jgi:WD40 repeat protein
MLGSSSLAAPAPSSREPKLIVKFPSGQGEHIMRLVFSPGGKILASSCYGDAPTIKLWDIPSGKNIATLKGHTREVMSLAFSPNGTILASISVDATLRLWDVTTGQNIATIAGRPWESSMCFSRDGRTIALGGCGVVEVWDIIEKKRLNAVRLKMDPLFILRAVAFTPGGKLVALAAGPQSLVVFDVTTGEKTALEVDRYFPVTGGAICPDRKTASAICSLTAVRLWDLATGKRLVTIDQPGQVTGLAVSSDGKLLALSCQPDPRKNEGGPIRLLDARSGKEYATLKMSKVSSARAFTQDGTRLATCDTECNIYLWDVSFVRPLGE